jgi:hypothetical protein
MHKPLGPLLRDWADDAVESIGPGAFIVELVA